MDTNPPIRFLTESLNVKYRKPTPLGPPIELRGKIRQVKGRKVIVDIRVIVNEIVTLFGNASPVLFLSMGYAS